MTVANVVPVFQITTAAAVVAFMVTYWFWASWRQTVTGKALMTMATTVLALLLNSLLKLLIGQYFWFDVVRLCSYILLTVVWSTMFVQLRRAQQRPMLFPSRSEIAMPARLKTALSVAVHALVGLLISVLVAHGIDMPAGWSAIIETGLLGIGIGAYAALTHWLSTRPSTTWWGRAAVWLSKVLTLGTGALMSAPSPTSQAKPGVIRTGPYL